MTLLGLSEGSKPEYSGYSTDLVTDAPRALPGQLPPSWDVTGLSVFAWNRRRAWFFIRVNFFSTTKLFQMKNNFFDSWEFLENWKCFVRPTAVPAAQLMSATCVALTEWHTTKEGELSTQTERDREREGREIRRPLRACAKGWWSGINSGCTVRQRERERQDVRNREAQRYLGSERGRVVRMRERETETYRCIERGGEVNVSC